jgi:two-component system, response regulator
MSKDGVEILLVDGIDVLRQIPADAPTVAIPMVILTSSAEVRDIAKSCQRGLNHYLVKLMDFEQFNKVAKYLGYYGLLVNRQPVQANRSLLETASPTGSA